MGLGKSKYIKNIYLTEKRHQRKEQQESRLNFFKSMGKMMMGLVAVSILVSLFWITRNFVFVAPYFSVKTIEVSGNNAVSKDEILKLSEIEPGQNIFKLNLVRVQYQIKENPLFENVQVKRCLPDKVEIKVEERVAAAFLNVKGNFYLVSENGIIFKKLLSVIYQNLPIITNVDLKSIVLGSDTNSSNLKTGLEILKDIRSVRPEMVAGISEINAASIDEIIIYTNKGIKVKVNKNMDKNKWLYLNKVINTASADKISIEYIDMRYHKQIVLKPAENIKRKV